MADDMPNLTFTTASHAVITKGRGVALIGVVMPAAVDNSAATIGLEGSFDGGTAYNDVTTDVSGTATPYRPAFAVNDFLVFDPTVVHALEGCRNIRVSLFQSDGNTAALQTSTVVGLIFGKIQP